MAPRGRPIWISLVLRGSGAQLRKNPYFLGLDSLGFPWILSSEMSLFNGLRANSAKKKFASAPSPRKGFAPVGKPVFETDDAATDFTHGFTVASFLLVRKNFLRPR